MLSSPMDSELILFLEENGFAECKSRAGEFDKTISNNYNGGLRVNISEVSSLLLNKNKRAILILILLETLHLRLTNHLKTKMRFQLMWKLLQKQELVICITVFGSI